MGYGGANDQAVLEAVAQRGRGGTHFGRLARLAPMHRSIWLWWALVACLASASARAESSLEIAVPASFGVMDAVALDTSGKRVGSARLEIEKLDNGEVRVFSHVALDGGAQTTAQAILAPINGGRNLRILRQESRSIDPDYNSLGVLSIDHSGRVATCSGTDKDRESVRALDLPESDRVVNVPYNLLFSPLVDGSAETMDFQIFVCRPRPYLVSFRAGVERREPTSASEPGLVEISFEPQGGLISFIARRFAPELVFWFEPKRANPWIAHRFPLYSSGPDVVVVREGVSYGRLMNGR